MQALSTKLGCANLAFVFERETTPTMKESVLSCFLSFLSGANFPAKRKFVAKLGGLGLLKKWICIPAQDEEKIYGQAALARKTKLKLLSILYDLAKNDDSLINDGTYVRSFIRNSPDLIDYLLS